MGDPRRLLFLGEPLTRWRVLGVSLGIAGLVVMFNPLAFDWSDGRALLGNAFIMLAALCWAISILQVRAPPLGVDAVPAGVLGGAAGDRGAGRRWPT